MLSNIINNLNWSVLINMLSAVIPALICITFHELAHGFTAYRLGDNTAKEMGRLTLNPIKHIDVFGLLMMIFFKFGWAKPVPVNMYRFKRPKWYMAITAIAGPLSNIILAAVVLFIYGLALKPLYSMQAQGVAEVISNVIFLTAYISVALAVFNLLPIPPLDGSKVLFSLLPSSAYYKLMQYERYGIILLIVFINIDVVFRTNIFGGTIGRLTETLFDGMLGITRATLNLINR